MAGVNATVVATDSDVQLINQLGYYIVSGGETQLPDDCCARCMRGGYQGAAHVTIAALIEFIQPPPAGLRCCHESDMRRGKATANAALAMPPACWSAIYRYPRLSDDDPAGLAEDP